jgi:hypothetical protein
LSRRFELFQKALDSDGDPVSGATLEFFVGGSSFGTAKDVYSDADLTTPISQPITYNAAGNRAADIFCSGALYDVRFTVGSTITTIANYDPGLAVGLGVSSVVPVAFGGTGANNAATARSNIGAASNDAVTEVQEDVTTLETQIAPGLNGSNVLGVVASLASIARTNLASGFGEVVSQTVTATPYTANSNLSTTIPLDDTTPTISEGTEILTANITPLSSSNKVKVIISGCGGGASYLIWAIFRNSTCIFVGFGVNNNFVNIATEYEDSPATTSPVTYSVRVGSASGDARMNGNLSGRYFGGTAKCTMVLKEIESH